jgi:GNAT superfamily N-acetyltransferase
MAATLRAGRSSDARALAQVFQESRRDGLPYLPELHTEDETIQWMSSAVLAYGEVAVAEVAGEIAGFAAFEGDMLGHLYVRPDFQHQGVGSALLDWAKETRPRGFTFWVFQRNDPARRFYERRGCRLVELTDGAGNEEREPDALYEWFPTPP